MPAFDIDLAVEKWNAECAEKAQKAAEKIITEFSLPNTGGQQAEANKNPFMPRPGGNRNNNKK